MPVTKLGRPRQAPEPVRRRRGRWSHWAGCFALALAMLGVASLVAGCTGLPNRSGADPDGNGFFGWHVQAPFDTSEIKTVFVFFKSQSFRRDIQQMLTLAVQQEIDMRTPYKVVGDSAKANSIIRGTIVYADKNLIVEAPTNLPRQLSATMNVWVNWTHNPPTEVEKNRPDALISETLNFVPEVGETSLTAFNDVTQNIAKQIVDMMETPWFADKDLE
ncbi:MAG TPA: hypothetical protein VFF52_24955 [Isosphaeraceae bacterium]|nr:hypothetical protein [Isosphaeraceae bacterium]